MSRTKMRWNPVDPGVLVVVDVWPLGPAYLDDEDATVQTPFEQRADESGALFELPPNVEVTPAETVYRLRAYTVPGVFPDDVFFYAPVSDDELWIGDYLTDPPGSIDPSGLAQHQADGPNRHAADAISVTGDLGANVQEALDTLESASSAGEDPANPEIVTPGSSPTDGFAVQPTSEDYNGDAYSVDQFFPGHGGKNPVPPHLERVFRIDAFGIVHFAEGQELALNDLDGDVVGPPDATVVRYVDRGLELHHGAQHGSIDTQLDNYPLGSIGASGSTAYHLFNTGTGYAITGINATDQPNAQITPDGTVIIAVNKGTGDILFPNEHPDSASFNRFKLAHDVVVPPDGGVGFIYDSTAERWRCFTLFELYPTDIPFDPAGTDLAATNIDAAIRELAEAVFDGGTP